MQGYDPNRFEPKIQDIFTCPTCTKVVREPQECQSCGQMYCAPCQPFGARKCINQCEKLSFVKISGALLKLYNNQKIRCSNPECNRIFELVDYDAHERVCHRVKCLNFESCQEYASNEETFKAKKVCGLACQVTLELCQCDSDLKKKHAIVAEFLRNKQAGPQLGNSKMQIVISASELVVMRWDPQKCGSGISLSNDNFTAFLKESAYMFRTVFANVPLMSGVHYWEIEADNRTENELKIGVCCGNIDKVSLNSAFCDQSTGFAYYGLAQLRNGSNATGQVYGRRFKKEGTLGVCLNMQLGTLSFALNGEYMGVAFKSEQLKQGPIYAAVALLHCAGCTLRSGKPKPSYME